GTLAADDDALERLDTRALALDDLDVDLEGVARAEGRDVGAQRRCVDRVERVHVSHFPALPQVRHVMSGAGAPWWSGSWWPWPRGRLPCGRVVSGPAPAVKFATRRPARANRTSAWW